MLYLCHQRWAGEYRVGRTRGHTSYYYFYFNLQKTFSGNHNYHENLTRWMVPMLTNNSTRPILNFIILNY